VAVNEETIWSYQERTGIQGKSLTVKEKNSYTDIVIKIEAIGL